MSAKGKFVYNQIETKSEDTHVVCCLSDGRLATGHCDSTCKIWSPVGRESTSLQCTLRLPLEGDVSSICQSPIHDHLLALSVSSSISCYDLRNLSSPFQIFSHNVEEINQIRFHTCQPYMCACDDAGEIKVISTKEWKVLETLTGCHSNLCTCVSFLPLKPWEIVSGSMDCKLVRWNWSKATPLVEVMVHENMPSGSTLVNPPMVYSLDTWADIECVACGLGNGVVAVYDIKDGGIKLKCLSTLHCSMVVCVCCIEKLETINKHYVVSGGNDGKIVLSMVTENLKELKLIYVIQHCSKINCISVDSENIFVADQTPLITVYKIKFE